MTLEEAVLQMPIMAPGSFISVAPKGYEPADKLLNLVNRKNASVLTNSMSSEELELNSMTHRLSDFLMSGPYTAWSINGDTLQRISAESSYGIGISKGTFFVKYTGEKVSKPKHIKSKKVQYAIGKMAEEQFALPKHNFYVERIQYAPLSVDELLTLVVDIPKDFAVIFAQLQMPNVRNNLTLLYHNDYHDYRLEEEHLEFSARGKNAFETKIKSYKPGTQYYHPLNGRKLAPKYIQMKGSNISGLNPEILGDFADAMLIYLNRGYKLKDLKMTSGQTYRKEFHLSLMGDYFKIENNCNSTTSIVYTAKPQSMYLQFVNSQRPEDAALSDYTVKNMQNARDFCDSRLVRP